MGYGLGVFLLALGLILRFAVNEAIPEVNLAMIGLILAASGVLVLILTAVQTNARRRSTSVATTTHANGSQTVQERHDDVANPTI